MVDLQRRAKELLENKLVDVVVGYGKGTTDKKRRAIFVTTPEQTDKLIFDELCLQNIAVYLTKNEILHHYKKIAIVSPVPVLRTLLQLASEEQVKEESLVILGISPEKKLLEFANFQQVENYLPTVSVDLTAEEKAILAKIDAMNLEERWNFWVAELSKCYKCYACRQSCPMCYCNRCMVECNQPQWIHVPAHEMGNIEWHLMRAMHLAGRCVNCGDCARACALDIPLNLLTYKLIPQIQSDFHAVAGMNSKMNSVMSTYKPNDKEHFIK